MTNLNGVFLPVITPFKDGALDLNGYENLVRHYLAQGIHGLIPLGTTGEVATLEDDEGLAVVEASVSAAGGKVPIYVGVTSNSTKKAVHQIQALSRYSIDGFLVTSPYYTLPSQDGILEHYKALAGATDKNILVYNIPHRTGRNLTNATLHQLSAIRNIAGVKDTCGLVAQTIELLRERDPEFSVLCGDDILFFLNAVSGGNGGILASAHFQTELFVQLWNAVRANDLKAALEPWNKLSKFIPLLFQEPSPGPIKHLLQKKGLIESAELRLPMTPVSVEFGAQLDKLVEAGIV